MSILHIALFRPEIPPNTGNIARLAVGMGASLHIVGQPAFSLSEAAVRRAGLDYWDSLQLHLHEDWGQFLTWTGARPLKAVSKLGSSLYTECSYTPDDVILFGNETSGLPAEILAHFTAQLPASVLRIPMLPICRSLNLSNAVAVVLYEAWRQNGFL